MSKIKKTDIVGLAELHTREKILLPGYIRLEQKFRTENHKGPKISGGLAIFVKQHLQKIVHVVPSDNEESTWIKIKQKHRHARGNDDIYIGTFYMSPKHMRNKNKKDLFTILNEEVGHFKNKGRVCIQGDINARTGLNDDFIKHDKFDEILGIENLDNQLSRNSEDHTMNARGQELLDFCKTNDFLIVNGRKSGDLFGKFTSHMWNGSSVVDYFLTSITNFYNILTYTIGDYIPWLSDHCPIYTTIVLNDPKPHETSDKIKLKDKPPNFIWDERQKENFQSNLSSCLIKNKLETLVSTPNPNPELLYNEIKDTLLKTAKRCNLRKTKTNKANVSPIWFDKQCSILKHEIQKLGKILKENPCDIEIRNALFNQKRQFKRITKMKKRRYKKSIIDRMKNSKDNINQKSFWKLFNKLDPTKKHNTNYIPHELFVKHFQSTLSSREKITLPPDSKHVGPLDYPFSIEELNKAKTILKPGKATGIDNLSNEMIACFLEEYPLVVTKLFNIILDTNQNIREWSTGIITPIFKKGCQSDPTNYRGISLLSCFSKVFMTMLNNRLLHYALENKIISVNQLGFLPNNRTSDAHLILHNLIQNVCHKNSSYIYTCFIDFKSAFDTIPRDILFQKLIKIGITGNFFNTIKKTYENDDACINLNNNISESFKINRGVRQGCILSPLLFNIFMSDLPGVLDSVQNTTNDEITIPRCLLWADDIVLMSEREEGLKDMLKIMGNYCNVNQLILNTDKTKCMIFNKTGRLVRKRFHFNNMELDTVRSFKYLGFLLTPSGEIKSGLKDLRDRAMKAFFKLKTTMGVAFNQNVTTTLFLLDTLIKPILLYASDFWGCLKLPKDNPIENFHHMACKHILGVQKQTTNIGVLLELGRIPLKIYAVKAAIKNWERIKKTNINTLLYSSYNMACINNLTWITNIKNYLETNGMLCFYINVYNNKPPFIHKKVFQKLYDSFHQNAFYDINNEQAKLRTYGLLKTTIGFEKYLEQITKPATRITVTKLRLSNHNLMIETGRYNKIPKELRLCPLCLKTVETEIHFLVECPVYTNMREKFLERILLKKPAFAYYANTHQFLYLLSDENILETSKFIEECFELRKFLMDRPKMTI